MILINFVFFSQKASRDESNTQTVLRNFAILQKNILDIGLNPKLKTPANEVEDYKKKT